MKKLFLGLVAAASLVVSDGFAMETVAGSLQQKASFKYTFLQFDRLLDEFNAALDDAENRIVAIEDDHARMTGCGPGLFWGYNRLGQVDECRGIARDCVPPPAISDMERREVVFIFDASGSMEQNYVYPTPVNTCGDEPTEPLPPVCDRPTQPVNDCTAPVEPALPECGDHPSRPYNSCGPHPDEPVNNCGAEPEFVASCGPAPVDPRANCPIPERQLVEKEFVIDEWENITEIRMVPEEDAAYQARQEFQDFLACQAEQDSSPEYLAYLEERDAVTACYDAAQDVFDAAWDVYDTCMADETGPEWDTYRVLDADYHTCRDDRSGPEWDAYRTLDDTYHACSDYRDPALWDPYNVAYDEYRSCVESETGPVWDQYEADIETYNECLDYRDPVLWEDYNNRVEAYLTCDLTYQTVLNDIADLPDVTRLVEAKSAVKNSIDTTPDNVDIGLVSFSGCETIRNDGFFINADRELLKANVDAITAYGQTPIAESMSIAAAAMDSNMDASFMVLVTDGEETCAGDPCAIAAGLSTQQPNLIVNVIDMADNQSLSCIADYTGGIYSQIGDENGTSLSETVVRMTRPDLPEYCYVGY